jgi:hypothetical protein
VQRKDGDPDMPYIVEHLADDAVGPVGQTLHDPYSEMSYDLSNETTWKVMRDPVSGDYYVDSTSQASTIKPRWVKHLVRRKKARPFAKEPLPQRKKQCQGIQAAITNCCEV